jgi:hypothetical protein
MSLFAQNTKALIVTFGCGDYGFDFIDCSACEPCSDNAWYRPSME